ncbi:MAG: phospholipase D family protein [Candidatus Thermoplasmatota archaeon]|nr:phospholipase D family protein [Candidatus Thermoplasmatota archaeon]
MAVNTDILFGKPQKTIAYRIREEIEKSTHVSIISGFATEDGLAFIEDKFIGNTAKLETFVVGTGTLRAFSAFDRLIRAGVDHSRLRVHLGYSRLTNPGAKKAFYQYHPTLHSKIYYFEREDETASAIIGSHNMTAFAMGGLNGEASVVLQGNVSDPIFAEIRKHINQSLQNTEEYDPSMKRAYAWWYRKYVEGLSRKVLFKLTEDEIESVPTIILFTQNDLRGNTISPRDIIYVELPNAFKRLKSLDAPVHLYIFSSLPASPTAALALASTLPVVYKTKVSGTNDQQILSGRVNWVIREKAGSVIEPAPVPLQIKPRSGYLQIFLEVTSSLRERYEYLFQRPGDWIPVLAEDDIVSLDNEFADKVKKLNLIPPEHLPWFRVKTLEPASELDNKTEFLKPALMETTPESGSFALYSIARRKIDKEEV